MQFDESGATLAENMGVIVAGVGVCLYKFGDVKDGQRMASALLAGAAPQSSDAPRGSTRHHSHRSKHDENNPPRNLRTPAPTAVSVPPQVAVVDQVSSFECLCEDLRVPSGNQCLLAVPWLGDMCLQMDSRDFAIVDTMGVPLLCATIRRDASGTGAAERLVLMGWSGRTELATGKILLSEGSPQCLIFRPSGGLFATIKEVQNSMEECTFIVSTATGQPMLRLAGDPQTRRIVVTSFDPVGDHSDRIVAALVPEVQAQFHFDRQQCGVQPAPRCAWR